MCFAQAKMVSRDIDRCTASHSAQCSRAKARQSHTTQRCCISRASIVRPTAISFTGIGHGLPHAKSPWTWAQALGALLCARHSVSPHSRLGLVRGNEHSFSCFSSSNMLPRARSTQQAASNVATHQLGPLKLSGFAVDDIPSRYDLVVV